jgi:hypothetical protein
MCLPYTHKWKIIKEGELENMAGMRVATTYIVQCENCGELDQKIFFFKAREHGK